MNTRHLLAAVLPLALALACSDPNKAPAEAALKTAEEAIRTMSDATMKFAPEKRSELERAFGEAQALAAKKDYKGALAAASAIPQMAQEVVAAANGRKAQVNAWAELSSSVAGMVAALRGRLEGITQSKQLPPGVTQGAIDQAKVAAAGLQSGIEAARDQAQGGDIPGALVKATELKAKTMDAMKSVGMMQ